ncbi:MAG TPA: GNAT family N-acetyltransferase, partial [Candidatus Eisenbacteria bacterium]
ARDKITPRDREQITRPRDTERITFRSWRPEDEALALALWGDPRVTGFIDARPKLDVAAVRERLAAEIAGERAHGIQYWPIFKRATGERDPEHAVGPHLGCCGLRPHDPPRRIIELGVHLRPEHWGQGFATEASRSAIAHAFTQLGAHALFAGHHPENTASKHTLERLGFRRTGVVLYPPTGLLHPAYLLERRAAGES